VIVAIFAAAVALEVCARRIRSPERMGPAAPIIVPFFMALVWVTVSFLVSLLPHLWWRLIHNELSWPLALLMVGSTAFGALSIGARLTRMVKIVCSAVATLAFLTAYMMWRLVW